MKRAIYNIVLIMVLGLVLGACSKEEVSNFVVPTESILVSKPGETGTTNFDSRNITSIEVTTLPTGWVINAIDLYKGTITVTAPSSFKDDEVTEGDLVLTGYTPTGKSTTVTVYLAILPNADIDFTGQSANCYVVTQPNTRYKFDPFIGGESEALETARVELLWETRRNLIEYIDFNHGRVSFYVGNQVGDDDDAEEKLYPGNALIGAFNADGELIWSWHIWVTNNDPMAAENITTINGREVMKMNLGAISLNDGSGDEAKILASYGLYYQWGRRTPLPGPFTWNFTQNEDARLYNADEELCYLAYEASTADTGTEAWSNLNPISVILGNPENNYNWLYSGTNDTLWSTEVKTSNDPCPRGWRVPDSSLYANLTIAEKDDAMSWQEAQPMYGWMLKDTTTGEEHFFTAAGRRNYLDGRLDNMNTNLELPVPWSGYYWTTSTDGAMATAMYFNLNTNTRTWNGFDAAHPMQRANALPIRCVRE